MLLYVSYRPIPGDNCTKGAFSTYMSSETALCSSASGRKEEGGKASEPHKSNSDSNKVIWHLTYLCMLFTLLEFGRIIYSGY